jgi:hypothetical protein
MSILKLSLTAKGLQNIPQSKAVRDFAFVVGDTRYFCPWFVADFLSTKVGGLHAVDSTIDEFFVTTEDPNHQFESFLSLGSGSVVAICDSNRDFFIELSRELGSHEVLLSILSAVEGELSTSNVINRIEVQKAANFEISVGIEFVASHFDEIPSSDVCGLSYEDLDLILGHGSLKLMSEDSLCEFLLSLLDGNLSYFGLFEHLRFEYLSVGVLTRFCDFVSSHFECLNVPVWSVIRRRLLIQIPVDPPKSRLRRMHFSPVDGSPLSGIISYLSRQCDGNVHTAGLVTITGHNCGGDSSSYAAWNAADLLGNSYFWSNNEPNQWLNYDFGSRRVNLTHYTIWSHYNAGENDYYLRSWVIEGSNDGDSWTELDRREDDLSLNVKHPAQMFQVQSESGDFRHLRLRQIGPNQFSSPSHALVISGFELFGWLTE